jgi:hypothetical protein
VFNAAGPHQSHSFINRADASEMIQKLVKPPDPQSHINFDLLVDLLIKVPESVSQLQSIAADIKAMLQGDDKPSREAEPLNETLQSQQDDDLDDVELDDPLAALAPADQDPQTAKDAHKEMLIDRDVEELKQLIGLDAGGNKRISDDTTLEKLDAENISMDEIEELLAQLKRADENDGSSAHDSQTVAHNGATGQSEAPQQYTAETVVAILKVFFEDIAASVPPGIPRPPKRSSTATHILATPPAKRLRGPLPNVSVPSAATPLPPKH